MPKRYAIGIDLGGTKVEACLVDESRAILARKRIPSEPHEGKERVLDNILRIVAETAGGARYEAVGMGTPGTYDPSTDIMFGAPHTPLYEKPGIVSGLRSRLDVPLLVDNDANCLALAEYFAQCADRYSSVMAVIMGTGMGSGLVLDRKLYRGPSGSAGEIGHTTVDVNGRPCECGRRGCGEAYLSGPSHSRRYKELTGESLSLQEIYRRYERGDAPARRLFDESVRVMGELFSNMVNALDLEAIVLGGGVSNVLVWYERVPEIIRRCHFGIPGRPVALLRAVLGDSAGVLGAAYLALREMGLMTF